MNDYIWFSIITILLMFLGLLFMILGYQILVKQKTDLIISYHIDKVSQENKKSFSLLFAIGLLIIAIGFCLSGLFIVFDHSTSSIIPMIIGLLLGMILLVFAVRKYNR